MPRSSYKLTLNQVAEIRRRLANGEKAYRLASEYNVTYRHLLNIKNGRKWK
jgi:hypothetical protein